MDNATTVQYAGLLHQLAGKTKTTVRDLDPNNELTFLRIRTQKHEIMVAPGEWMGREGVCEWVRGVRREGEREWVRGTRGEGVTTIHCWLFPLCTEKLCKTIPNSQATYYDTLQ